jgi:putative ABC transport system permease protein
MKFLRLIVKNAGRNKRRTLLTILSIGVSVFLLATMLAVIDTLGSISKLTGAELRLVVRHKTSLVMPMPESYREKIAQVPGVVSVCPANWFGGIYKEDKPEYFFAQFFVDPKTLFDVQTEYQISPEEKAAFQQERTGAIAGRKLAEKFGWKIGDVIELTGAIFPVNPHLRLRGVFTAPANQEMVLYFHRDYVEEALERPGQVGTYRIKLDLPDSAPRVMDAIDNMFVNSAAPTKTETEAAFQASFVSMLGNVKGLIAGVGLVVVFTISLIAANAMAMSTRERFTEVAVMKALGFRPELMLGLILSESMFIALVGGLLGALGAKAGTMALIRFVGEVIFLQNLSVSPAIIGLGLLASVLIGLLSGGIPAWNAARISIVDGLRRVA